MKNIQVIDGAINCRYPIYMATEEEFALLFPDDRQDIEFIEDVISRVDSEILNRVLGRIWERKIQKSRVSGIHGTLFYELEQKKKYYPTKRESEMIFVL